MGEEDVGGVDFIHESPPLLFRAESGVGGEEAELLETTTLHHKTERTRHKMKSTLKLELYCTYSVLYLYCTTLGHSLAQRFKTS